MRKVYLVLGEDLLYRWIPKDFVLFDILNFKVFVRCLITPCINFVDSLIQINVLMRDLVSFLERYLTDHRHLACLAILILVPKIV